MLSPALNIDNRDIIFEIISIMFSVSFIQQILQNRNVFQGYLSMKEFER